MSYDLLVFDHANPPKTRQEFMVWYERFIKWEEQRDYDSPEGITPALYSWFEGMREVFPPMNGEFAPTDEQLCADESLESRLTDYSIGAEGIYAAFAWSQAEKAYQLMRDLAIKYKVGFFDVSGRDGEILLPDGSRL